MQPKTIEKQPIFENEPDLYLALGVKEGVLQKETDEAYVSSLGNNSVYDQIKHLAWKVLRDSFYSKLYQEKRSLKYLYEAGFFVDKIFPQDVHKLEFVPELFCTPIHKILNNLSGLKPGEKPVVLLTTGGFSPIHYGHMAIMEIAKQELEKSGYKVLGGYFSPSHDDYVSTKYGGEAELNSNHRIHLGQLASSASDWLMVDPWEARFVPTDINFTDVVLRLKNYLDHFVPGSEPIDIFYVFGADNAKFARVFKNRFGCVCVGRENVAQGEVQDEDGVRGNPKIIFTQNIGSYASFSSTAARKWKANLMPDEVSEVYFKWRKNILSADDTMSRPKKLYVIRDEDQWAVEPWIKKADLGSIGLAKDKFKEQLSKALQDSFWHVLMPDLPLPIEVRTYHLDEQASYVEKLEKQEKVLNLDMCTNKNGGINLSRQFFLGDGQLRPDKLIGRPGFLAIDSQISAIKAGEYTLLDDDIASGSTINMLMGILPENVKINKIRTLMDFSRKMYNHNHLGSFDQEAFDTVDLRDFILGAKAGGLVVRLPSGELARAPYLEPYISMISRASISPSSEMVFSKRLWEINLEFFESFGGLLVISDIDSYAQKLFYYLGFKPDMLVADLCRWHLNKIFQK